MTWSSKQPQRAGWYWWRQRVNGTVVLLVVEVVGWVRYPWILYPQYGGRGFKAQGGEWQGPIIPEET